MVDVYRNSEFYHLRNCLVELAEELKLRRNTDKESEERIKLLVNEKYELEKKVDSEVAKINDMKDQQDRLVADVERNFQEKMHVLEEENKQLVVNRKCYEKEMETLKDTVRSLQLGKYSMEKSLREQEYKLQSHQSLTDQQMRELSALGQKLHSATAHFQQLQGNQERLEKNVTEAVNLNQKLVYVNEHQKCLMDQQKYDLSQCQQKVVLLSSQIECQPTNTAETEELEQRISLLEHQVKLTEKQREDLDKELEEYKDQHQNMLEELQDLHKLVDQNWTCANKQRDRCDDLESLNKKLKVELVMLEEQVDNLQKELSEEKIARSEASINWAKQEEFYKSELKNNSVQLENGNKTVFTLEETNRELSESMTSLSSQCEAVKALLDVEKEDTEQQTLLSLFSTSSASSQTELNQADVCVQMQAVVESSYVQTDSPVFASCMSQTIIPSFTNCSVQTESPETLLASYIISESKTSVREKNTDAADACVQTEIHPVSTAETQTCLSDLNSEYSCQDTTEMNTGACIPESEDELSEVTELLLNQSPSKSKNKLKMDTGHKPYSVLDEKSMKPSPNLSSETTLEIREDTIMTSRRQHQNFDVLGKLKSSPVSRLQLQKSSAGGLINSEHGLPVARHKGSLKSSEESGTTFFNVVHPMRSRKDQDQIKFISERSKSSRSRALYSDRQLLWEGPVLAEDKADSDKKSPKVQLAQCGSLTESWRKALTDEQSKASIQRRSPRSGPKMGLSIFRESPRTTDTILGKSQVFEEPTEISRVSKNLVEASVSSSSKTSTPNLENDPVAEFQDNLLTGKGADGTPSGSEKGILKVPWSLNKPSKTVRFGSVSTTLTQSPITSEVPATYSVSSRCAPGLSTTYIQASSPSWGINSSNSSTISEAPPQASTAPTNSAETSTGGTSHPMLIQDKPVGERLLFSDEDDDHVQFVSDSGMASPAEPSHGRKRKRQDEPEEQ